MTARTPNLTEFQFNIQPLLDAKQAILTTSIWQEKYRQIMQLGKQIPQLAEEFKIANVQVKGCESQAWLYHCNIHDRHFYLIDSDARVVKGLAGLLLAELQGQESKLITEFDAKKYFADLGLSDQLSPSRTSGLTALFKQMQHYAQSASL